jgi:ribonuclease R
MLVGRRSGRQFRIGDKLTIRVVAANLTKRQLDYEWVITAAETPEAPPPPKRRPQATHRKSASPRHPARPQTRKKKK